MDFWGFFHLLPIANNPAMNVGLQVHAFSYFGPIPRSGIAGSCGNFVFNFLRSCHKLFKAIEFFSNFSKVIHLFNRY